ncbi:MAG: GldG family protein [Bacteriovoracaceae bacterium]|nr:GldG family protein [Bacteriovoracaceae bacterium]
MKSFILKAWFFIVFSLWIINAVMFTVAQEYALLNRALLGSAIGLSALMIAVFYKKILQFLKRKKVRMSLVTGVRIFLVICILSIVNYIGVKSSFKFDLTSSKLHTLSEQSKEVASQVDEELEMVLFAKRSEWDRFLPLLGQYRNLNKKIKVNAVDIESNPSLTKLNNIEKSGTVVLKKQGKSFKSSAESELSVTNLLIKSLRSKSLNIYYTTGHGELEPFNEKPEGGSYLFKILNNGSYNLKPLDTLKVDRIPADADAVLSLGPVKGFMDLEVELFEKYLNRGGNVFLLLGPNFQTTDLSNLRAVLEKRGIKHHNALVLDRLSAVQGANATIPIVNRYNHEHSVTNKFTGRTLFPLSAALESVKVKNTSYHALAMSSPFPASWAESQLKDINSGKVYYTKGLDLKGPVGLLAVTENSKDFGKLAVSASVEFVNNSYQNQSSNFNLFMNTLSWLVDDEGLISLNRPALSDNMIVLSAPQISLIFYFSILFSPFCLFAIGIWVYRKRVNK